MPTAIALRHVPFEDLGLLGLVLDQAGWSISYREAPTGDLTDPSIERTDLLVVLGGPIGAYETEAYPFLAREIDIIERRLADDRPTLGICLGSQLMAKALGAQVYPGPTKEIGWGRLDLAEDGHSSCLRHLGNDDAQVLHWHGDTFDLPAGAVRLASNVNYANQAFAFGRRALATQFHIEADPHHLEQWYVGHAAELAATGVSIAKLRTDTAAIAPRLPETARLIFTEWLEQIS